MSLQVSALADLEARIASLGGLLNSYSSECSTPASPEAPRRGTADSRLPRSPSLSARSPASSSPRSVRSPTQSPLVARRTRRNRWSSGEQPSRSGDDHRNYLSKSETAGSAGVSGSSGGGGRAGRSGADSSYEAHGSRRCDTENGSETGGLDWSGRDGRVSGASGRSENEASAGASAAAVSMSAATSELAQEVEELLRASAGHSSASTSVGDPGMSSQRGPRSDDDSSRSSGSGERSERKIEPAGWDELEGMAERLNALAEGVGVWSEEGSGRGSVKV